MAREPALAALVEDALGSLEEHTHRLEGLPAGPLPCLADVGVVAELCRAALFPEVCATGAGPLSREERATIIASLYDHTAGLVARERHGDCGANPSGSSSQGARAENSRHCPPCRDFGATVAHTLIGALGRLRSLLESDLSAALDADPAARSVAEVALCYPGFQAIATHRVAHELWRAGAFLVARLLSEQSHARTGIEIHPGATIGRSFFIDHGTGVVIGETADIGERVRLYQGVTLGARSVPKDQARRLHGVKRHPTLENDVIVYANATILGGDTVIGEGAIVGGNVWVTTSVAARSRVSLDVAPRAVEAVVAIPSAVRERA